MNEPAESPGRPIVCGPPRSLLPSNTFDLQQELADVPSDAFVSSSSSPQKSPQRLSKNFICISSQSGPSKDQANCLQERPNLAAPQNGLRQMNLFGAVAQHQTTGSTQQGQKVHNWPLTRKDEPPTHHKLDHSELKVWVYPTNIGTVRDYQYNIVARGLFHNLLVALPTGLGKTFIAATIMLNWYRWTKDSQIVFVAPTKPLVSQQVEACFGIAGIPRSQTSMLTGGISPGLRAEEWSSKRVFFMTPQTIVNDLKTGICDPKKIVLLVVDEAHRATGAYAYVEVVKFIQRFNQSFRILALTATPGNNVQAVQDVIDGLGIARVEIRTEHSIDIQQYVHSRNIEIKVFDNSPEMGLMMEYFSKAVQPVLAKLTQFNAYWSNDPIQLTAYGLTQARQRWMASGAGKNANFAVKGMINRIFAVLASLAHSVDLLKYHGIVPFYHGMVGFRNSQIGAKGGKYEGEILQSEPFQKMMAKLQYWSNDDRFICHPKLEYLQEMVLNHFAQDDEDHTSLTRIMIFAHFRDSAEEIVRVLRRHEPMIKPHVFVGQAASKGTEGMDQRKQLEIINEFKKGTYNTLVATSIGEEGLDIGEIDLIICYDSSASPIRMLQRMGRTGRKRAGNIMLLLMRGKEQNSFLQAKDSYEKMQGMIADGKNFEFHDEKSPRILPRETQPVVDMRAVEIPIENTQAELPEPTRKRGRAPKRPPKKFHMPDGVQTGFVRASRVGASDDEDEDEKNRPRKKQARGKSTYNLERIPTLEEVLLSPAAEREHNLHYRQVANGSDLEVRPPGNTLHPERQRSLTHTKYVRHGRASERIADTLQAMWRVNEGTIRRWKRLQRTINLDELCSQVQTINYEALRPSHEDAEPRGPKRKPTQKTKSRGPQKQPARRGRKRSRDTTNNDDAAAEGISSSPAPTDPRMAMPSQGINLGTSDTSGEDQEEEADSELEDFIVGSSQAEEPAAVLSSSPAHAGRRRSRAWVSAGREDADGATGDDEDKPFYQTQKGLDMDSEESEILDGGEPGKDARATSTNSETSQDHPVHNPIRRKRTARIADSDEDGE